MEAVRSLIFALFPQRKETAHTEETHWEITVAKAAPLTPQWKTKIKRGSRAMLTTAPNRTVSIPVRPKPWALIKLFIPKLDMAKTLPQM